MVRRDPVGVGTQDLDIEGLRRLTAHDRVADAGLPSATSAMGMVAGQSDGGAAARTGDAAGMAPPTASRAAMTARLAERIMVFLHVAAGPMPGPRVTARVGRRAGADMTPLDRAEYIDRADRGNPERGATTRHTPLRMSCGPADGMIGRSTRPTPSRSAALPRTPRALLALGLVAAAIFSACAGTSGGVPTLTPAREVAAVEAVQLLDVVLPSSMFAPRRSMPPGTSRVPRTSMFRPRISRPASLTSTRRCRTSSTAVGQSQQGGRRSHVRRRLHRCRRRGRHAGAHRRRRADGVAVRSLETSRAATRAELLP